MRTITQLLSVMLAFSFASQGNNIEQVTIPLSSPDESGVLVINHHKGSIDVTGYDGDMVIVMASMPYGTDESITNVDNICLGAVENNNNVVINAAPTYRTIDLKIMVPYKFSVRIKKDDSGVITITGLSGEMEVSNLNDDIILTDISGSAVLDTIDGGITAQLTDVRPGVPMAFSTIEGNVDVVLPGNLNATIKAKADYGTVWNDFLSGAAAEQQQSTETPDSGVDYEHWDYMKINSGGTEIRVRSFMGNINVKPMVNE